MYREQNPPSVPTINSEQDFVGHYGGVVVQRIGQHEITLQQYYDGIDDCPVEDSRMEDPTARLSHLAGRIAAVGALDPSHAHFIATPEG